MPKVDDVRVLLGAYGGHECPIPTPSPIVCLDVVVARGASWTFTPPPGHVVAWAFVYRGRALVVGAEVSRELVVLDERDAPVTVMALGDARLLFG
ncbi:MAG: hypothetical protein FJ137_18560 [Deltaproteobacteria bacterium]|nr:hypothetical protein [Deltaproteobacteria bacterium]